MDDGEFNLSNTIGIGLNIGEQMLLPVSNGTEEAQLLLQQQQAQQHQHQQHLHEQQQHHLHEQQHLQHQQQQQQQLPDNYVTNLNTAVHLQQPTENLNNPAVTTPTTTADTTNVTCLDNSIGGFYQEVIKL